MNKILGIVAIAALLVAQPVSAAEVVAVTTEDPFPFSYVSTDDPCKIEYVLRFDVTAGENPIKVVNFAVNYLDNEGNVVLNNENQISNIEAEVYTLPSPIVFTEDKEVTESCDTELVKYEVKATGSEVGDGQDVEAGEEIRFYIDSSVRHQAGTYHTELVSVLYNIIETEEEENEEEDQEDEDTSEVEEDAGEEEEETNETEEEVVEEDTETPAANASSGSRGGHGGCLNCGGNADTEVEVAGISISLADPKVALADRLEAVESNDEEMKLIIDFIKLLISLDIIEL